VGHQLYRRLPQAFVVEVLETFNGHRMTERQACTLLGLKRSGSMRPRRELTGQPPCDDAAMRGQARLRSLPEGLDLPLLFAVQHQRPVCPYGWQGALLGTEVAGECPAGGQVTVCWRPEDHLVMLGRDQRVGVYALP